MSQFMPTKFCTNRFTFLERTPENPRKRRNFDTRQKPTVVTNVNDNDNDNDNDFIEYSSSQAR